MIFSGAGGSVILKEITKNDDGKYMLYYLKHIPDWEGSNATWPCYDLWYYWDVHEFVLKNDKYSTKKENISSNNSSNL